METPAWFETIDRDTFVPLPLGERGRPLQALDLSSDDQTKKWVVIAPAQVRLHPEFQGLVRWTIDHRPDLGLIYGDELGKESEGETSVFHLKPSLNETLLFAKNYVGFPIIVRASLYSSLGGLKTEAISAAPYDFVLRAMANGVGIDRIPQILLIADTPPAHDDIDDRRRALKSYLGTKGQPLDIIAGYTRDTLQVRRRFDSHPPVTLVIPTMQSRQTEVKDATHGQPYIVSLLNSLTGSSWPLDKLRVLIGDDIEDDTIYRDLDSRLHIDRILTRRRPGERFNYAAKMNALWRRAETEHIVLMNDDLVVEQPDWLEALFTFAMDEHVGGAGPLLLYPDRRIQHAGIPGGLFGGCAHAWLGQPYEEPTYEDWLLVHREWSIITGAVFASRRSVLEQANGFDETFSLEYNDIDLCLRLGMLGYKIVYTPFARLVHYEKASRGETLPGGYETARFLKRWRPFLDADPAFHPFLARDLLNLTPVVPSEEQWWSTKKAS